MAPVTKTCCIYKKHKTEHKKGDVTVLYEGCSSQTGTFNFTGIKRDVSMAVLHTLLSGKCVLLLTGRAHVVGQSSDR